MTHPPKGDLLLLFVLLLVALGASGCGGWWATRAVDTPPASRAAAPATLPSDEAATESAIRFLEDRVKRDPEDFLASNMLAGRYLERQRETGDLTFLDLAARAARASLDAMPAEMNAGGLTALAQVAYASHDFAAARDHARRLMELEPNEPSSYHILGDSLLELGDYDEANAVFQEMERRSSTSVGTETRLARYALLYGESEAAQRHLTRALRLALNLTPPPRETVAWCYWQMGETSFALGDYEKAERHYNDSLTTFPDYFRALASLGRVRAARGDLPGAIGHYERAIKRFPDPAFVSALGDLYKLAGRDRDAAHQYALVEQIARLSALNGELYNRQLALFYADHDIKVEEAYTKAAEEYKVRRDIYGADALAWTALKAGKLPEAQTAIKEALRLGTRDAKLFYHAGMIARAAGDQASAREYLNRALALSPQFDPLQSSIARKALEQ